jgi:hypothetical protein
MHAAPAVVAVAAGLFRGPLAAGVAPRVVVAGQVRTVEGRNRGRRRPPCRRSPRPARPCEETSEDGSWSRTRTMPPPAHVSVPAAQTPASPVAQNAPPPGLPSSICVLQSSSAPLQASGAPGWTWGAASSQSPQFLSGGSWQPASQTAGSHRRRRGRRADPARAAGCRTSVAPSAGNASPRDRTTNTPRSNAPALLIRVWNSPVRRRHLGGRPTRQQF